jgi:hypothetical protein
MSEVKSFNDLYFSVTLSINELYNKSYWFKKYNENYFVHFKIINDVKMKMYEKIADVLNDTIKNICVVNKVNKIIVHPFENKITSNIVKYIKFPIKSERIERDLKEDDIIIKFHDNTIEFTEEKLFNVLKYQPLFMKSILKLHCSKRMLSSRYMFSEHMKILISLVFKNQNIYFNLLKIFRIPKKNYRRIVLGNGIVKTDNILNNINSYV